MSNRWSKAQIVGDCKTCLCRLTYGKHGVNTDQLPDATCRSCEELSDSLMSVNLLKAMNSMRKDESLCDIRLCLVDSESKISAHKVVLAAASPYFRNMFSCGLAEAKNGEVTFHDMQLCVLQSVVHFIYTGKVQINENDVDGLLDAADLFQLPSLRSLCLWWLKNNLTPSTCLGIYTLSLLRSHYDLAESAKVYAIRHFKEVMEGGEFLELSAEHLPVFLESPYIGCDSESQLFKGVLEWATHNAEDRQDLLLGLMEKIHLLEVAPQILIEVLQSPVISGNEKLEALIRDSVTGNLARKFDYVSEPSSETNGPLRERCFLQQDVILAIGGESQGQSLSNVECFIMGYEGWRCSIPQPGSCFSDKENEMVVVPTMKQCRYYSAVVSNQYSVYVLGGQDCGFSLNLVEKYDILQNKWRTLCPVPISVHGCGAVICNSKLYLIGGRSSKSYENRLWVYDEPKNCWYEGKSMKLHRGHLAVAGFNGEIFAVGGIGGEQEGEDRFLSTVEKYDPLSQVWTSIAPMHESRAFHCAAVIDCSIYCLGGCNGKMWLRTVERFDLMCGQWSKVCNMSVPRSSFGVCCCNGRIYCAGGFDGVNHLNTVEKYNPRTDRWHCVHSMQIDRYGLGVTSLSLPLKSPSATLHRFILPALERHNP